MSKTAPARARRKTAATKSDNASQADSAAAPAEAQAAAVQDTPAAAPAREAALRLEGELTIYGAAQAAARLLAEPLAERLDLAEIDEIDTTGLQLLLVAQRGVAARGGQLRIVAASAAVRGALELLHLQASFGLDGATSTAPAPAAAAARAA